MATAKEIVRHLDGVLASTRQKNFRLRDEVELLLQFELRATTIRPEMDCTDSSPAALEVIHKNPNAMANEVVVMLEVIAQEHVALCPNFSVNQAVNDDREHVV